MAAPELPVPRAFPPGGRARHRGHGRHGRPRALDLLVPGGILLAIFFACFALPLLYPIPDPVGGDVLESNLPPLSPGHLLGTDANGNDVASRLLHGGRASLQIAVAVNVIGLLVGGAIGAIGGYGARGLDALIMRVLDVAIAFPSLVLVLAVVHALGPGTAHTILALALFSVPAFARVARAATLRLREQPFITAARVCGTGAARVLVRHIVPNIAGQLVTFALLGMGVVIVIEGALSFLGLGVPLPRPSWGNMIQQGQQSLSARPMLVLLPSAALCVTVLSFNLLGERLRSRWSER
ncbi:MAG TPA: ABC transporter permease [Gammaproteobacteria bacterium]